MTTFYLFLHFWRMARIESVKFDANIFIGDRYMAILLLYQFGCEMPILAHFGEVLWGFDPVNVVRYCRDPKRHILGWKHALWHLP